MKLAQAQRDSLIAIVKAKLALWTASTEAEKLFAGVEIDTCDADYLCSAIDDPSEADGLSDETLLSGIFGEDYAEVLAGAEKSKI